MHRTVTCGKALIWSQTLGREGGREVRREVRRKGKSETEHTLCRHMNTYLKHHKM